MIPIEAIIIFGALTGALYALLALGFTFIYGVANIVNMAHGALFMVGAYTFHALWSSGLLPLELPMALILAAFLVGALGSVIYRVTIRPVIQDLVAVLVVTIGLTIIFQQLAVIEFGPVPVKVPSLIRGSIIVLGVNVSYSKLLAFTISLVLVSLLSIFIAKTKIGKALRAIAQDREAAMLMGVNTERLHLLTMGISASFAAVAGILVSGTTTEAASPYMWAYPLALSFAVVILGGLGSIKGSLVGAFIIAFAETAVIFLVPQGSYLTGTVAFAIMVIVLLVRPKGLFGKRVELE